LPRIFHIDIPDQLAEAVESCKTDAEAKQVGIEWCIQQSKELMEFACQCCIIILWENQTRLEK
jgi:methylenetetrahydrofolate reductase (NADPH)